MLARLLTKLELDSCESADLFLDLPPFSEMLDWLSLSASIALFDLNTGPVADIYLAWFLPSMFGVILRDRLADPRFTAFFPLEPLARRRLLFPLAFEPLIRLRDLLPVFSTKSL